jgi:hypothetical protein
VGVGIFASALLKTGFGRGRKAKDGVVCSQSFSSRNEKIICSVSKASVSLPSLFEQEDRGGKRPAFWIFSSQIFKRKKEEKIWTE